MLNKLLKNFRSLTGSRTLVFLTLLVLSALFSQAAVRLGELTFSEPRAQRLEGPHLAQSQYMPESLKAAVASYSVMLSVGGVAFDGVAVPKPGFKVTGLNYLPDRPDGSRLEVTLTLASGKTQAVTARLHDWQLQPLAQFADDRGFACVTLFGQLVDREDEAARLHRGEKIINYHPAFENTLLGLRLMQADILILYEDSCELVKQDNVLLLGGGEKVADADGNRSRLGRLHQFISGLSGGPFQSYLICDYEQQVNFGATNGELELTGFPYWYCWKLATRNQERIRQAENEANDRANKAVNEESQRGKLTQEEATKRFHELWDQHMSRALLQSMPVYSRELSAKIRNLDGINPAVYQSLVNTMRYAAFFRHVKTEKPKEWQKFLEPIRYLKTAPAARTPTVMILPAHYPR